MDKEITTISNPQELVNYADENDVLFHLSLKEAALLLNYVHLTNNNVYRALGERDGKLFMKKGTVQEDKVSGKQIFSEANWREVTLDEVVDEACEMNYELRSEILERLEARGIDFMDRRVYETLLKDSNGLEKMFSRTQFSKKLDEMAESMAEKVIQSYLEKVKEKEENLSTAEKKTEHDEVNPDEIKEEKLQQKPFVRQGR